MQTKSMQTKALNNKLKRNELKFYLLILFIGVFMLSKISTSPTKQTVNVTLLKQDGPLRNINDIRRIKETVRFAINSINFPKNEELYYKEMGNMAYKKDFFLSLKTTLLVKKAQFYQFSISSDDGFKLSIDNQLVCQYEQIRAMKITHCDPLKLKLGLHSLQLDYFQGFGDLGLVATYVIYDKEKEKKQTDNSFTFIGQDSNFIQFIPLDAEP